MNKNIVLADDHPIIITGVKSIVQEMGFEQIDSFNNGLHALNHIFVHKPSYALLDVRMPGMCGLEIAENIRTKKIKTKVIIYTMYPELALFEKAKRLEVHGYLLKEFAISELKKCINVIERGGKWYSPRLEEKLEKSKLSFDADTYCTLTQTERNVLKSIAEKKSSQEIADDFCVSIKTIENHRRNISIKLELPKQRNALLIWAIENKGFFSLME